MLSHAEPQINRLNVLRLSYFFSPFIHDSINRLQVLRLFSFFPFIRDFIRLICGSEICDFWMDSAVCFPHLHFLEEKAEFFWFFYFNFFSFNLTWVAKISEIFSTKEDAVLVCTSSQNLYFNLFSSSKFRHRNVFKFTIPISTNSLLIWTNILLADPDFSQDPHELLQFIYNNMHKVVVLIRVTVQCWRMT